MGEHGGRHLRLSAGKEVIEAALGEAGARAVMALSVAPS